MNIQRVDYTAPHAAEEFVNSLRNTGFAVLYNHPIKKQDAETLYQNWETQFFDQPDSVKQVYLFDPITQVGWAPSSVAETAKGYSVKDIKEYFNFFPYGNCPAELREHTTQLREQLLGIGLTLLTWLQTETPNEVKHAFSAPLTDMVANSPETLFRLNYYPALSGDEPVGALRAAPHADIDMITVLMAGTQAGLQAKDKNGNWHDVPCEHGNIVINAGDMLQEITQGYYPSTIHQVLMPTGDAAKKPRMSCPLFIHPRPDVVLSERYTQASYLHERLVELGFRKA